MVCLLHLGPQCIGHCRSPGTANARIHLVRPSVNSGRPVRGASQQEHFHWHGVVPPLLAPQRAWASDRRGASCVADSHKGLGETTVALQNPGSEQAVAYVLGVPTGGQASADVSQQCCLQLTQFLQHLQQQQQQQKQHQQLLVLLDSAAAAHTTSGATAAATDAQVQQQLALLVAAYGGQLQVLPEQQQQQAALGVAVLAAATPARSTDLRDLANLDAEDDLAVLMARLAAKQPPPEVLCAAAAEVTKLRQGGEMQPGAAEARSYLELLAHLSWSPRAWQELEQERERAVRSNTALPPLSATAGGAKLPEEQQDPYHASDAEQSSTSRKLGALLLSGLGQAGRAAASAATAAAGAVLDVIEGATMATVAALAAYDQRGVEVAADLPDTSLRPSTAVDWRKSPEDGQTSWQAALAFCALLIQLENAGYDVVITGGDDDEDSAAGHSGFADDDHSSGVSPQERVLLALIEHGILSGIPDGSIVRVVAIKDGAVGVEVTPLPRAANVEGSMTTHLQNLLADGATPEQLMQAWPELRKHPVLERFLDGAESNKDQQRQQQEWTDDGSTAAGTAAAEKGDSSGFTPLGMIVGDGGTVFLLGVDRNGNIRVKEEPTKPGSSSSSKEGSKAHSDSISDDSNSRSSSSSSSGAAAGLSLDFLLEAGQLPLSTSNSRKVSGADASSNDNISADAATTADDAEVPGPDSKSSSDSSVVDASSSAAEQGDSADQASATSAATAADDSADMSAAAEQSAAADNEALGPVDPPKALSSSDAIHLLKKEFRRRVSSATQSSSDDDVTAAAAADGSSGSDDDDVDDSAADVDDSAAAADDDGDGDDRKSDQQQGSGSAIARSSTISLSDDDVDRLAVRTNSPELLAAMLQLERSWHSSSSSSSGLKQPQSDAGPPAAAAGGQNGEPVPELLPRPLRPPQPDQHSSSKSAEASGSSSTADTDDSSSSSSNGSSSKQSGLTEQEAAEVQAIIKDTRAAADDDLPADGAAVRLRSRRNKQRKQLQQQQQGKQDNINIDASSSNKADQPVSSSSSDGSSGRSGQGSASAQASIDSDSDSDSDVDVTDLFHQFAAKLESEGVFLDEDEQIALFVDLYGEDSDQDSDGESEDDESAGDESEDDDSAIEESAGDASSPAAASSSSASSSKEGGGEGTSSKDNSSSNSSRGSDSSNVRAAAAGDTIRSRRSQDSNSSSKGQLPGGPGWDQLGRMVGGEALSKLRDLLRSGNVRLSGLNPVELGVLLTGLARLQKGERLDSQELSLLLRFINEAEITPEGEEQHPDEKLKRRHKVLRRQQQQSRAGLNRSASSRAHTLGFGVGIKDKAYVQDTRSLRVPKSVGNSRGEQVKQLLAAAAGEQQHREYMLAHRQALQYARLHLSATLEVNVDQDAVDSTRTSSSDSSNGSSIGKDSGARGDVQQSVAEDLIGGAADVAPGVRSSNKARSASGWRAALKSGLGSVFGQGDAKPQRQQQPPATQHQQQAKSSSTSVNSRDQQMHSIDDALLEQQQLQQALQAKTTMLIQQLQQLLAESAGAGLGTTPADADAAGASARRVVVAVVPLDQLECVRQQWDKATGT